MAKQLAEKVETKGNIENLAGLRKEYLKGEMNPRKEIMLKERLLSLNRTKVATPEELDLMEIIFKRERSKGKIEEVHLEQLNRIERDRCTDFCFVRTEDTPAVHKLHKDQRCKVYLDHDSGRYVVYIDDVIPTEHQLSRDLVLKEQRGHFVAPEEYPPAKIQVRRLNLKEKEFKQWFEMEEDLLKAESAEETYTF